jgi:predicted restriction endonuclease
MAKVLLTLIGPASEARIADISAVLLSDEYAVTEDEAAFEELAVQSDIGSTERKQLIRARRGQGLFRAGVSFVEQSCRLTGVADKIHLVASHIKPWAKSNNEERLNRYNGLLLAPHADHLFDHGFLSFENNGAIVVSKQLDRGILHDWHIDETLNVGLFRSEQHAFLEYHRDAVLKR